MKVTATLPDGEAKVLLDIPNWDFAWQDSYIFSGMVALPKGTRLDGEVVWDNTASNPHNPTNPPALVTWGERSFDEMGSVTLELLPHRQSERTVLTDALSERVKRDNAAATERDPGFKDYFEDLNNGRTPVFQAGERKEH
jgi:hypothetical protein